jgi:hypothetical protein
MDTTVLRDDFFWKDLQATCREFQANMLSRVAPILGAFGVINYSNNTIRVDISKSDPLREIYPIIELGLFVPAVFYALLREELQFFTDADKENLKKYILSCGDSFFEAGDGCPLGVSETYILSERLTEYYAARRDELSCGFLLQGPATLASADIDRYKRAAVEPMAKCALLMCDHIAYIKHFGMPATYKALKDLDTVETINTKKDYDAFTELFAALLVNVVEMDVAVKEALDGGLKKKWKANGLCQHCGSKFKASIFGKKCSVCKTKKDY